jgi:2-hydroxychromene-2-carboxylate isomerase
VRRPCPDEPSLGRRSAPHGADFGFREPLTPHLARPGTSEGTTALAAQLRVLEWRYGEQLGWRLVTIGLRDRPSTTPFDAARSARRYLVFRDLYGMPFRPGPKERAAATGRGCRAVVAARLLDAGSEWRVLRGLQLANFTTELLLDDDERIRDALGSVPGIDADAIVERLDDEDVRRAYEADKAEARTAAGTAAEAQGKTSTSDGPVRFTAPSVVFEKDGTQLVAGGWQPMLAYDVLLANLDPTLERTPPPESPAPLLDWYSDGLTTAEIAALLAEGPDYVPDLELAEALLVELSARGQAERVTMGQDAVWRLARHASGAQRAAGTTAAAS